MPALDHAEPLVALTGAHMVIGMVGEIGQQPARQKMIIIPCMMLPETLQATIVERAAFETVMLKIIYHFELKDCGKTDAS